MDDSTQGETMMPTTRDEVQTITARLYALGAGILAKTGEIAWFGPLLIIKDDRCMIALYGSSDRTDMRPLHTAKGETPDEALADAEAFVAAMPDLATAQLQAHMEALAALIDKANAAGIANSYVTPLAFVVKAISSNLLPRPAEMTAEWD